MTIQEQVSPAQESFNFLKFIYPLGPWTISSIVENKDPNAKNPTTLRAKTFYDRDAIDLIDYLSQWNGKVNLYWQVNPLTGDPGHKARLEDVKEVVRFHVDLDPRKGNQYNKDQERTNILKLLEDENRLKQLGLPGGPSLIIDSGNGFWGFWNLMEPLPIIGSNTEELRTCAADLGRYNRWIAEVLNEALNATNDGDKQEIADYCHNVDRITRLPGTLNIPDSRKRASGFTATPAKIYASYPDRVYHAENFNQSDVISWGASANEEDFKRVKVGQIVRTLPKSIDPWEIAQELKRQYPLIGERTLELICLGEYANEEVGDDNLKDKQTLQGLSVNRSRAHWRVNRSLQQLGIPLNVILGILCDERLPISAHAREPIDDRTGKRGAVRSGRELIRFNEIQIRKCAISIAKQKEAEALEDSIITGDSQAETGHINKETSNTSSPNEGSPKKEEPKNGNEVVKHLNKKHAVLEHEGGKCCVLSWEISEFGNREIPVLQTVPDFKNRYCHLKIPTVSEDNKTKLKSWGDVWFNSPRRKQYLALRFLPGQPEVVGGYLNLWRGWAFEPKPGDWSLMRQHIYDVLADGNEEYAEYILNWAAWSVQNPHRPAEVALVFRGGKGVGKGIFGRAMQALFGSHGLQVTHQSNITGRFNGHLRACCLLFADEAIAAGDKQAESVLKGLVTEPQLQIERKRIDMTAARNHLHIIMASNDDWVVPASGLERRFAVFDVSNRHQQNTDYFNPLYGQIENDEDQSGLSAMLYDLLNRELGSWHPRQDIPQTESLRQQKEISLPSFDQFMLNMLEEGELLGKHGEEPNTVYSNTTKDQLGLYDNIRQSSPKLRNVSYQVLAKNLKKWGCSNYRGKYGRGWVFPKLAEMRRRWDKEHWPHSWPDNYENWYNPNLVVYDEDVPF